MDVTGSKYMFLNIIKYNKHTTHDKNIIWWPS